MRTLAEARAEVADVILEHEAYGVGWSRGFLSAMDLMGVDTDPETALSTGQVTAHDPLLDSVVAQRRDELARAREYRTPAKSAAQIRAEVRYSWARAEREIAARYGQQVVA